MDTDRWHCWSYTDHKGTLIISALMICYVGSLTTYWGEAIMISC
ncbi:unnamed protein product, partial [Staurois parvus]